VQAKRCGRERGYAEEGRWPLTPRSSFDASCPSSCPNDVRRAEPSLEEWRNAARIVLVHSPSVGPGSVDPHVSDDGSAQRWSVTSLRDGARDPVGEFAEVSGQLGRSAHFELAAQVQDL
jgi:hypothetical protein